MNKLILFALFLSIAFSQFTIMEKKAYQEQFNTFVKYYNKKYNSPEEMAFRFNVFLENLKKINELNVKYPTATFKVNELADRLSEEIISNFSNSSSKVSSNSSIIVTPSQSRKLTELPQTFDWREKNVVTSPKNQGNCGASHAFAAVGVLEAQYARNTNTLLTFSEQQLIDCDKYNNGCVGGSILNSYSHLLNRKIQTLNSYPFTGVKGNCQQNSSAGVASTENIFVVLNDLDLITQTLLQVGPLATKVDLDVIRYYSSGVIASSNYRSQNHHLLIVGYNSSEDQNYWILKNSMGKDWGENGYIRISRNVNEDCGVSSNVSYASILID